MFVLVVPIFLVALTVYVLMPGGGNQPAAAPLPATSAAGSAGSAAAGAPSVSAAASPAPSSAASGAGGGTSASAQASATPAPSSASSTVTSSSAMPATCKASAMTISAQPSAPSFKVGDQPVLYLQVSNPGPQPCVQDLADSQVELRVYNGESRLWGSHDCLVQPGTDVKTLAVDTAVRVGVQWSGLTSQPGCGGTRQRLGPGSYTLHALLAGVEGKTATFTIG